MIKRITKFSSLLVCAASIVSIVPAYAADTQKIDSQDGTVYNAKAKGNGIYIDGEIDGADEAVYWLTEDGKYNKLDIETHSTFKDELFNQYLEIDTGDKDLTYLDIKNNYKEVDYDVREDLEATVARAIKGKVKHDNDDRFNDVIDNTDFTNYYKKEGSNNFIGAGNGFSAFSIPLKEKRLNGETNSVIYGDSTGNYVDADYNIGSLKIYNTDSTTGSAVTIKNTEDKYQLKINDKSYDLKATLKENKEVTDSGDDVYRWADLQIYKKLTTEDDSNYTPVTEADGLYFAGKIAVDAHTTVLQKFSKTQSSDAIDGIKYSKDSTLYFVSNKDGEDKSSDLLASPVNGGKLKVAGNVLCSFTEPKAGNTVKAQKVTLAHKNDFNYLDIDDQESEDTDCDSADSSGVPWLINGGYLMKWDGDHSFVKVAKVDSGLSSLSIGSATKIIVWDDDKDIHSILNTPAKAASGTTTSTTTTGTSTTATTGAAVTANTTAQTGWLQNSGNTWSYFENGSKKTGWLNTSGTWYYLKSDGIMATGWTIDNGTWYYLDPSGAMKTGWLNDNETWYYLDASGAMLSNTTIDGYNLGSDGAWIQ